MKFSQRAGKSPIRESIQIESIDTRLENRLWNIILSEFFDKLEGKRYHYNGVSLEGDVDENIWEEFFGNRKDEMPYHHNDLIAYTKHWFFKCNWFEKYDLIEHIIKLSSGIGINFTEHCNYALKKEMAGYRVIDGIVVQITSEEEIAEIEEAILNSSKWEPVNIHIKTSINYLSNRENPDFRNSIKESISAVESLCKIITEDDKATLGKALSIIEKRYPIHGSLKSAISSLYGYTNDTGGIRHALMDNDIPVSFEDAKFMLVVCSAFINYLKAKIEK